MQTLTVLGSTGSIGANTLDVVRQNRQRYRVYGLAAGQNAAVLLQQILEFRPAVVVAATEAVREQLADGLRSSGISRGDWPELMFGDRARVAISTAPEIDTVVSAIVGVAGLSATVAAAKAGKRVALANKEVLVSAGKLMMQAVASGGAELIPVDSEHNGAHQCLRAGNRSDVTKLILTASGGPVRNTPLDQLSSVGPREALQHPTWKMGNRITIDSATLMNKGFEVIEACWLFGFSPDEVDVVIHPQSTVHAMVEYKDGSIIAQLSATDMRMPIQYALTYPERAAASVSKIDWRQARQWEFQPPDFEKFPLLKLAYQAQRAGGAATCVLNAADEVGVEAFLAEKINFTAIAGIVEETLSRAPAAQPDTIDDILEVDGNSRAIARDLVSRGASSAVPCTARA